jgi:glutathione S-transferase
MLKLYELAPSPNNTKVRMALRVKGIPFETVDVAPDDRSAVMSATGQPLAPAIEDRGIALHDSEAILHYLDANYRESPRLYPTTRDGRQVCDAFKLQVEQELGGALMPLFFGVLRGESRDDAARAHFEDVLHSYQDRLVENDSFDADGSACICDLRVAEFATYALPGQALCERVPLFAKLRDVLDVDRSRFGRMSAFLEPWNERLA